MLSQISDPAIFCARCASSGSFSSSSGNSTVVGIPGTMADLQSVISHVFRTYRTKGSWLIVKHPCVGCERITVDKKVSDASGFFLSYCLTSPSTLIFQNREISSSIAFRTCKGPTTRKSSTYARGQRRESRQHTLADNHMSDAYG